MLRHRSCGEKLPHKNIGIPSRRRMAFLCAAPEMLSLQGAKHGLWVT
jgi:hypothetical protein